MDNSVDHNHTQVIDVQRRYMKAMSFVDPGERLKASPSIFAKCGPLKIPSGPHVLRRLWMRFSLPIWMKVTVLALRSERCVDKYVGDFITSNKVYGKYVKCDKK